MSFKAPWVSVETLCEAWGKWNGCTLGTFFTVLHFFNLRAGTYFLLCVSAQKGCPQCSGCSIRTLWSKWSVCTVKKTGHLKECIGCIVDIALWKLLKQVYFMEIIYVYGSMHHNIFHEITNRCSYMQSILFHCYVHSTCFGRFIHPSSGVQFLNCIYSHWYRP